MSESNTAIHWKSDILLKYNHVQTSTKYDLQVYIKIFLVELVYKYPQEVISWGKNPCKVASKYIYDLYQILCVFYIKKSSDIHIVISSSDNKSVSHWIMFDYFFHV